MTSYGQQQPQQQQQLDHLDPSKFNLPENITTLYIRNLNEKISKEKLRMTLIQLFQSNNLTIQSMTIFKNLQLRGQAFVTLSSHEDCVRAIDSLNTMIIFDKPMDIYLAKANSDVGVQQVIQQQQPSAATTEAQKIYESYVKKQQAARLEIRIQNKAKQEQQQQQNPNKRSYSAHSSSMDSQSKKQRVVSSDASIPPNKMLLLTKIPSDASQAPSSTTNNNTTDTAERLRSLFSSYEGFVNITYLAGRQVAVIEFIDELYSANCLESCSKNGVVLIDDAEWNLVYGK